jgi:energy-coupling factor transport system permease protein
MLVLLAQRSQPLWLIALGLLICTVALRQDSAQFLRLLRRTRWIALSLLLVYAWATPGRAVMDGMGIWSPTWEGLQDGTLQLGRLLCALAGLAVLLASLARERLIAGLYALAWPMRFFGLSRERFAVRLALTLEYAEKTMHDTAQDWRAAIAQATGSNGGGNSQIELQRQPYGWLDGILLLAGLLILAGVWR